MPFARLAGLRLVLATVLLLFSAPVVGFADAVVFHGGETRAAMASVETPDAPFAHGDSCQLASHQGHSTPEATLAVTALRACGGEHLAVNPAPAPESNRASLPPARAPPIA